MRFSDMMGSGEERSVPASETDAISDALAPYLDATKSVASATSDTTVALEAPVETERDASALRAHTVESVFPVIPVPAEAIATPAPIAPIEAAPTAEHEPIAAAVADFTPLSDDLLPARSRRKR